MAYKFIRTSSEADARLCVIYRRFGSRFGAHVGAAEHTVVDTSRAQALLLLF